MAFETEMQLVVLVEGWQGLRPRPQIVVWLDVHCPGDHLFSASL